MKYNRLILITILTFVLCGNSSLSQTQSAAHDYETHTNNLVERSGLFDLKQEGTEGIQHLPVTCKKRLAATMEKNEVMDIFLFEISPACNVLEVDFAGKEYYTLVAGPTSIANIDITDLDGDGLNEIVAYYIYANGSKAQYLDIYKFDEDGLRQIFSYEMFSSGFYIESEDIYAYSIKNEYTPFEKLYSQSCLQT